MYGNYYKRLRKKNFLTQECVADIVGISRHSLSKYENHDTDMPITVAIKLNILFGIDDIDSLIR